MEKVWKLLKTGIDFAQQAIAGNYIGIPYSDLDCQAFVERVLKDTTDKRYNWKGSNDMYRNACQFIRPVGEDPVPAGYLLFTLKNDGGEVERGYKDGLGNACHVGIRLFETGSEGSIHSTTGGVQFAEFPARRWTHCGPLKCLDYSETEADTEKIRNLINDAIACLKEVLNSI